MKTNKKNTAKVEKTTLPLGQSLLLALKGIISNQACIDNGHAPWYVGVVLFLISVVLTWVPVLQSGYTSNGSSFLTTRGNGEVDVGFKALIETDYAKSFTINTTEYVLEMDSALSSYESMNKAADGYSQELAGTNTSQLAKCIYVDSQSTADYGLDNYEGSVLSIPSDTYVSAPTYSKSEFYFDAFMTLTDNIENTTSTSSTSSSSSVVYEDSAYTTYLLAYYFPEISILNDSQAVTFISNFIYSVVLNVSSTGTLNNFPHSFVIITKDYLINYIYSLKSSKSNSVISVYSGNLNSAFKATSLTSNTTLGTYLFGDSTSVTTAFTNFCTLINLASREASIYTAWVNVGYLCAIVAGTILVAAAVLLFMHKRKTSIIRDVNFFNTLMEAICFAFTPCVIGLALGFMNFTYGAMGIIGGTLLRIVFAANRLSPPVGSDESKPLYQARS